MNSNGRSFTATGPVPRGRRPRQHLWQGDGSCASVAAKIRAFSSEVETGSRQENASNQEFRAPLRFHRSGKGSSRDARLQFGRKAKEVSKETVCMAACRTYDAPLPLVRTR